MSSSCGDHWRSGPNGRFAVLQGNPERRLPVRADGNGRHIVRDRGRLKLSVKSMWDRSPSSAHVSANNYDVNGEDRGEAASDAAASESIDRWRGGGSAKSAPPLRADDWGTHAPGFNSRFTGARALSGKRRGAISGAVRPEVSQCLSDSQATGEIGTKWTADDCGPFGGVVARKN